MWQLWNAADTFFDSSITFFNYYEGTDRILSDVRDFSSVHDVRPGDLAGSRGWLWLEQRSKLRILRLPSCVTDIVVSYNSFFTPPHIGFQILYFL